ncbi:MAG: AAC(3) family N-acetyltransferase [Pseudomonadota bacterium]
MHASMGAIGTGGAVEGGAAAVIEALQRALGPTGLIAMPGFSTDASFPASHDRAALSAERIAEIEAAVPGHDPANSPTVGMGVIAETFRTWPGTRRSSHPTVSICLNGPDTETYLTPHARAWACGPETPLGHLRARPAMKMLLIGVGWNRCTALHTAETLATTRRTKVRRFKSGAGNAAWLETPDVADDLNRLFPGVGAGFEATGAVRVGKIGAAEARLCPYAALVAYAAEAIDAANRASGDRH